MKDVLDQTTDQYSQSFMDVDAFMENGLDLTHLYHADNAFREGAHELYSRQFPNHPHRKRSLRCQSSWGHRNIAILAHL